MFKTYPSNVTLGSAHNYILCYGEKRKITARSYLRVHSSRSNIWRFWFSNQVDSTYSLGDPAYVNRPGGNFTIVSARIGDGGPAEAAEIKEPPAVTFLKEVTFDGKSGRDVQPCEKFWSDEVEFDLPKGHYLVWEWEIVGDAIPCTPDSQAPTFVDSGSGLEYSEACPMPDLFGCRREVKKTIAFLGDSITQGCGTRKNHYEMWAARIAAAMGEDYAFWNLGLGFARASDAATDESWLYKAKQADAVCIACGTNDNLIGAYKRGRPDTADEILSSIRVLIEKLQSAGLEIILFTLPPFEFSPSGYETWKTVNTAYPALAKEYGITLHDFSASLDAEPPFGNKYIHGAHPDGEGGRVAAEAFIAGNYF